MIKFQSFLSSSSGNATYVTDDVHHFLVDCGGGCRYICECFRRIGVKPEDLTGIFITHEHRDHIAGVGILSRKYDIPVYATEKTWQAMESVIGNIRPENKRIIDKNMVFGTLTVKSFSIPHDAAEPVGYSFITEDDKFSVATDMGFVTDEVLSAISGSRSVIIEANHDTDMLQNGPYPFYLKKRIAGEKGHLPNKECAKLCIQLLKTGTEAIWLGHLSAENNKPELAYSTIMTALEQENLQNSGVSVNVLPKQWLV